MTETKGKLLILDDDPALAGQLGRTMERRGFEVIVTTSAESGLKAAREENPDYALVDMRLDGKNNGLDVIAKLRDELPECKIVMYTAYGNIATSVAAIKAGATDYLAKPADPETIERALLNSGEESVPEPPEDPMTADRVRWEHIQRVYEQCGRNISETARKLKMHRRSLQRILAKHAPHENPVVSD